MARAWDGAGDIVKEKVRSQTLHPLQIKPAPAMGLTILGGLAPAGVGPALDLPARKAQGLQAHLALRLVQVHLLDMLAAEASRLGGRPARSRAGAHTPHFSLGDIRRLVYSALLPSSPHLLDQIATLARVGRPRWT